MDPYTFLPRTSQVIMASGDAAARLRHEYVGTEHMLLALLQDRQCTGTAALIHLGVDLDVMRATIEEVAKVGNATTPAGTPRPYTSRCKKVLELAMKCAREDDHAPMGTQHLLLGLLREEKGIAAQVLSNTGVSSRGVVEAVRFLDAVDADESIH